MLAVAAGVYANTPASSRSTSSQGTGFTFAGDQQQGGWIRGKVPAGTVSLLFDGKSVPFAPDGSFFVAFDRDAGPRAVLSARRSDGSTEAQQLAVAPRAWRIENINAARRPGGATDAFMALRRPELARINAARAKDTGATGWRQQFIWPVKGRISGMFGSQRVYRGEPGAYHSGLDIATGGTGTPFVAPADGVVILAAKEPFTLEGHLLMIDHGMGLNSAFLHCSALLVEEGDVVKQGQLIGRIGATGRATGPHLHWSMKWNDARIDPILLTGPMK
ncbi:MAG: M23 family metallopeptidase [Novosphingobium sp.]|nr:M23 family metallopeptidase [Novosphingobium sp.]